MANLDVIDLELTPDGDLTIHDGDLGIVQKQEYIAQSVRNRVKISDPEWYDTMIQNIGANLEDLIGLPNNQETAEKGVVQIGDALTRDGLLDSEDIYIRPVPVSRYFIVFYLFVRTTEEGEPLGFELLFNLESGLMIGEV